MVAFDLELIRLEGVRLAAAAHGRSTVPRACRRAPAQMPMSARRIV
jgi:hypothetical protein